MKKIPALVLVIAFVFTLSACTSKGPDKDFDEFYEDGSKTQEDRIEELSKPSNDTSMTENEQSALPEKGEEIGVIETNHGTIKIKFFKDAAPELSKNFVELAKSEYYDGLKFHRVINGFVIQGGDPKGDGTGGHSYKGEGTKIGDEPGALALKHYRGAVAWAKSALPNSIGSQFYIAHKDVHQLDGEYSVFGQVFEGMEVLDKIAAVKTAAGDVPVTDVVMEKVSVEVY